VSIKLEKIAQKMAQRQSGAGYHFVGNHMHAAVKVCMWTKKAIRGEGACYKYSFYGIRSHRCVQMSPAAPYCNHSCIHCWRDTSAHFQGWEGETDGPKEIAEQSVLAQVKLLNGFPGSPKTNMKKYNEAQDPVHVAISLDGEPTLYPHLPQLICEYHSMGITTFLVSNGSNPDVIEKLVTEGALPTQLYISFNSPTEKDYKRIVVPLIKDAWQRYEKSLDLLAKIGEGAIETASTRTVLRMTLALDHNMENIAGYAAQIRRANPHFVEVKAYMALGSSRKRLGPARMPTHKEIREFAAMLAKESGYVVSVEHIPSRIVLLCRDEQTRKGRMLKIAKQLDEQERLERVAERGEVQTPESQQAT